MIESIHDNLLYLSNTYSKLLKRSFGKGPESCQTILNENRLYVYIRNFITPGEEILLKHHDTNLATNFRSAVIDGVSEQFLKIGMQVLGIPFVSLYHDWNYDSNTGMLMFVSAPPFSEGKAKDVFNEDLFKLILKISSQIHKTPNELTLLKFTQNMCVIEAKGITLKLESLLYEKGDIELLHSWRREIKKSYLIHKKLFEEKFGRSVDDLFIVWDYKKDLCYLIFNFSRGYLVR